VCLCEVVGEAKGEGVVEGLVLLYTYLDHNLIRVVEGGADGEI
jgi:hypothetical protein